MATMSGRFNTISLVADEALTAHTFVTLSSDAQAAYVAASTADAVGIAMGAADAGKMVTVQTDGIAMVKAGAAVAQGAVVTSADDGEAVTATTGDYQHGYALEAASGAGEIISVLLKPAGIAA